MLTSAVVTLQCWRKAIDMEVWGTIDVTGNCRKYS
jgi:hypothetical protein